MHLFFLGHGKYNLHIQENPPQAAEPATVTVETEGTIPPEVANQVIENATAALEDSDKAKADADEVQIDSVPGLATGVSILVYDRRLV